MWAAKLYAVRTRFEMGLKNWDMSGRFAGEVDREEKIAMDRFSRTLARHNLPPPSRSASIHPS
jgi:hypothetical protein